MPTSSWRLPARVAERSCRDGLGAAALGPRDPDGKGHHNRVETPGSRARQLGDGACAAGAAIGISQPASYIRATVQRAVGGRATAFPGRVLAMQAVIIVIHLMV